MIPMHALQLLNLNIGICYLKKYQLLVSKCQKSKNFVLKTVPTTKSFNCNIMVKDTQLCDAAAAVIYMNICTNYDDSSATCVKIQN